MSKQSQQFIAKYGSANVVNEGTSEHLKAYLEGHRIIPESIALANHRKMNNRAPPNLAQK